MKKTRNPHSVARGFVNDDEPLHHDVVSEAVAGRVELFLGAPDGGRFSECIERGLEPRTQSARLLDTEALDSVGRDLPSIAPCGLREGDQTQSAF